MLAIPTVKGRKSPSERFAGADDTYTIEALMQNGWALQSGRLSSHSLSLLLPSYFLFSFSSYFPFQCSSHSSIYVSLHQLFAILFTPLFLFLPLLSFSLFFFSCSILLIISFLILIFYHFLTPVFFFSLTFSYDSRHFSFLGIELRESFRCFLPNRNR
jgi:hypothetical protein